MQIAMHFILFNKTTSLTNIFLRQILRIYKSSSMIMALTPEKCCYMTFGLNFSLRMDLLQNCIFTIVPSAEHQEVLRTTIHSCLTFYCQLKQLCKKVASKLNTLIGITPHLGHHQKRFMYSSVFAR